MAAFAAMVNAAASHVVEQDDVHNASVFHPATVVFPPVLAVAEAERKSGRDILEAVIAGQAAGRAERRVRFDAWAANHRTVQAA